MFKVEELAGHGRLTITQSSEAVQRLPVGQADSASMHPELVARGTFAQYVDYSPRALLAWLSAKPGWRSFSHEYLVSWGVHHLPLVAAGRWWLWATAGEARILIITRFSCQEASCVCRRAASEGSADAISNCQRACIHGIRHPSLVSCFAYCAHADVGHASVFASNRSVWAQLFLLMKGSCYPEWAMQSGHSHASVLTHAYLALVS